LQTLEPREGCDHAEVQTELYIEELADLIEEFDVGCQTDEMLDRPPTPLFVPAKTGIDEETQIYEGDVGFGKFTFHMEHLSKPLTSYVRQASCIWAHKLSRRQRSL
jgi:Radial spoke protein 3